MLPLIDLIPRTKRMIDHPKVLDTVLLISAFVGVIDGLSLAALLPAITALARQQPVWGLPVGGWLWVLVALSLLSFVLTYVQTRRGYATALDFVKNVHRRIGDQVARLPLGWFGEQAVGQLSRMVSSQLMTAGEILAHFIAPLAARITAALVVLVCAWFWDWRLGLVLTLAVPVVAGFVFCSAALMVRGKRIAEGPNVALSNRIIEFAQCQSALRASGRSGAFEPLIEANIAARRAKTRELWLETAGFMLGGVVTQAVIVALIAIAAQLAVTGTLQPIPALAFIGLSLRFTTMLDAITGHAMALEDRRPMLDAYDELLTAQPLPEPTQSEPMPRPGEVAFEHVNFGYRPGQPVLRDLSFTIAPRSMVALVGPSGCGKTTVARLIARFYDPSSGVVRIGGVDAKRLTTADLMAQISQVFQDVYLFDDTILANVKIGRPDATQEEIDHIATLSGVAEIVARLPQGWASPVGEGGRALSGGERQRVSVARALLKRAPVVLLDEATSALDPENEDHITAAMQQLRTESTLIVIAHKLDTIERADRIIQFGPDGRIEDTGTHAELMQRGGRYAQFHRVRAEAVGWRLG